MVRHRAAHIVVATSIVAGLLAIWIAAGTPWSFAEARFIQRLSSATKDASPNISLRTLMPGDWQLVCDAHCYQGEIRLSDFDKTFPPISDCTENAWGLLFISPDGSYTSARGGCGSNMPVYIRIGGCVSRERAVLKRTTRPFVACPSFALDGG